MKRDQCIKSEIIIDLHFFRQPVLSSQYYSHCHILNIKHNFSYRYRKIVCFIVMHSLVSDIYINLLWPVSLAFPKTLLLKS